MTRFFPTHTFLGLYKSPDPTRGGFVELHHTIWLPILGQRPFFSGGGGRNMVSFKNPRWQSEKMWCFFVFFLRNPKKRHHKPILKRPFLMGVPRTSPFILRYIPEDVTAGT